MTWHAQVLTLYPDMFPGPLGHALAGKALSDAKWSLQTVNIRDFATDKHRSVDDTPAGGGAGMVLRADILASAIDNAVKKAVENAPLIYLTPRGKRFEQAEAKRLAKLDGAIFICGRFEGVDERVLRARQVEELSVGDYVLSGGEMAAMTVMDAVVRLLPGVVGAVETLDEESFERGLLEYPHYTKPQMWEGMEIPEVLLSGNHKKIADWRLKEAKSATQTRRADMWQKYLADNPTESKKDKK
jgi:tRNA (guanine37-N1)-methyltransferase